MSQETRVINKGYQVKRLTLEEVLRELAFKRLNTRGTAVQLRDRLLRHLLFELCPGRTDVELLEEDRAGKSIRDSIRASLEALDPEKGEAAGAPGRKERSLAVALSPDSKEDKGRRGSSVDSVRRLSPAKRGGEERLGPEPESERRVPLSREGSLGQLYSERVRLASRASGGESEPGFGVHGVARDTSSSELEVSMEIDSREARAIETDGSNYWPAVSSAVTTTATVTTTTTVTVTTMSVAELGSAVSNVAPIRRGAALKRAASSTPLPRLRVLSSEPVRVGQLLQSLQRSRQFEIIPRLPDVEWGEER